MPVTGSTSRSTTISSRSACAATAPPRRSGARSAPATNWSISSNGAVVLDATSGSDAGIDVVGSEYATVAAEQTVLEQLSDQVADQIVARLALYANRSRPAQ